MARIFNITSIPAIKHKMRDDAANMLEYHLGNNYLYCGWGNRRLGLESSPLANPYTNKSNARRDRIRVASRDEAVDMYRVWLWKRICADDQQVLDKLHQITPTTVLVCWCVPKRCHCEVISRAADWLRSKTEPEAGIASDLILTTDYSVFAWDGYVRKHEVWYEPHQTSWLYDGYLEAEKAFNELEPAVRTVAIRELAKNRAKSEKDEWRKKAYEWIAKGKIRWGESDLYGLLPNGWYCGTDDPSLPLEAIRRDFF